MLLEMKHITKTFGPVEALKNVSLTVGDAEIHGLLGENGAGKSTLMNVLAGVFPQTSGEIYLDGKLAENLDEKKSFQLGIRFIHQELNLINDLMVYENMFLGQELTTKYGTLDKKTMIAKTNEVLRSMELDIDAMQLVDHLETSRKQLVEIAKALLFESKLIIMDEPTTALTGKEIDHLFGIMRGLKNKGVSLIYISHKMPELFSICDKYTVLRDGCLIETGLFSDIDEVKATELLVGRSIVDLDVEKQPITSGNVMHVKNLTAKGFFHNISFDLRHGEVLAVTGLHGDGRGELAECLFGARVPESGTVELGNKAVNLGSIKSVMQSGIGMVPRNRKERSIIKDMSIMDNLSIAYFNLKHKKLFIKPPEEAERFDRNQKVTAIKVGDPKDYITSLSGGNQQKIILSRWLELDCDIYILDNPTQGIDVGAKFEIYKIINGLAEAGKSIIMFSSEFPEIYKVADRCIVMYKGGIAKELNRDELTEVNVMYYATGSNMEVAK